MDAQGITQIIVALGVLITSVVTGIFAGLAARRASIAAIEAAKVAAIVPVVAAIIPVVEAISPVVNAIAPLTVEIRGDVKMVKALVAQQMKSPLPNGEA